MMVHLLTVKLQTPRKRLANQLQDANGKLANYKLQLQNTAGAIADYQIRNVGLTGSINKASDVLINNGKRLGDLGSGLTKGLTVPIAAGVTAVTAAAISWESAFAGVKRKPLMKWWIAMATLFIHMMILKLV